METDANGVGIGAALLETFGKVLRPISIRRTFTNAEKRHTVEDREYLPQQNNQKTVLDLRPNSEHAEINFLCKFP